MITFTLSAPCHQRIEEWENDHNCPISYEGAIGGKITYCFTPTSIGTATKALCACGSKIDVTFYEEW